MTAVVDKFIKYVQFDTESDTQTGLTPSTPGQMVLAQELVKELEEMGMSNVSLDQNGYVMAVLPSNINKEIPTVGFVAHMDTSPDFTGKNVKPQFVENYNGEDIVLNKEQNIVMKVTDFPDLKMYKGQTLITTDGTTLLGADDKAGVAGCEIGELQFENFNAAYAEVSFKGRNVHPGMAKDKLINSMHIMQEFAAKLPIDEVPERTENYEGFYHLLGMEGSVENSKLQYIIRDFDMDAYNGRKDIFESLCSDIRSKYGEESVSLQMKDQYFNMREKIEPVKFIVDIAEQAMKDVSVTPMIVPIRGGTDGSRLSYMGLPCPNIFAGGHNFHGRFEYVPVDSMQKAVDVILKVVDLIAKK